MSKVVAFVSGHVERVMRQAGHGNRHMLLEQLTLLKRESDRQLPSPSAFSDRADSLIALLTTGM